MEGWSFTDAFNEQQERETLKYHALDYGAWIQNNCITTQKGFRCLLVDNWKTEISNEEAYELYLESLKSK